MENTEKDIISKIIGDIELSIKNKYEVNGEYFDTEEEAKDELNKLKRVLASNGYKVVFHSRLGFDTEKTTKYFIIRYEDLKISPVTQLTGEDILEAYLLYHYGSPLGIDEVNDGIIKRYEVVETDKKEIKKKLEQDKSKVNILTTEDILLTVKMIEHKLRIEE